MGTFNLHGSVVGESEVTVESAGDEVYITIMGKRKAMYAVLDAEHAMVLAGALERAAQAALRYVAARRDMEAYDKNLAREIYGD